MFSLEQCKKLAEWGMDIRRDAIEFDSQPLNTLLDADDDTYYRLPSLQEVIEFAAERFGVSLALRYDYMDKVWSCYQSDDCYHTYAEHKGPVIAAFSVIEKLEASDGR